MIATADSSCDSSENELLDSSLSLWRGSSSYDDQSDFNPINVDLHTAASLGQFDCVRNFLESGSSAANHKNLGGWTPLMYASYIGHDNIVHLLLDVGVDVEVRNPKGQTSLMLAACCGNESIAYFLLNAGADIEARDELGWTALFHATFAGHQNIVKFLLENGANMDAREPSRGMTPFMQAALEGHEIIVQDFLHNGVDVEVEAKSGDTARSMALFVGHTKVVSLIDNLANVHRRNQGVNGADGGSCEVDDSRSKLKGPSILDGPAAFARIRDRAPSNSGYRNRSGTSPADHVTSRDNQSPGRDDRLARSWSSGKSHDADDEDESDLLCQTAKLVRPGSSSGHQAALESSDEVTERSNFPKSLEELLRDLGLEKYMKTFVDQDVDLRVFLSLTDNDLKEVGIKLFGPRRKMTNAIARLHSEMTSSRDRLEQAYADRLEAEMQELAIQLHKSVSQVEKVQKELLQEKELRSVAEGCLMEAWEFVRGQVADTKSQCVAVNELTRRSRFCLRELLSRRQPSLTPENVNLDAASGNDVAVMADDHVIRLIDHMMCKIGANNLQVIKNTERLLGNDVNLQDSFGRVS